MKKRLESFSHSASEDSDFEVRFSWLWSLNGSTLGISRHIGEDSFPIANTKVIKKSTNKVREEFAFIF